MNVVLLLTPKNELVYLDDTMSINDALKKLRENRYTAIPLIDSENGRYLGTLSEGDLLWYLTSPEGKKADLDQEKAVQLLRPDFIPAVHIDSELNVAFTDGVRLQFDFKSRVDIRRISALISAYIL